MDESKTYFRNSNEDGIISISPDVIAGIAADACIETQGVSGMASAPSAGTRGIVVEVSAESCHIQAFILVRNSFVIADVAKDVQKNIINAIESGCGIKVSGADVFVAGIELKN